MAKGATAKAKERARAERAERRKRRTEAAKRVVREKFLEKFSEVARPMVELIFTLRQDSSVKCTCGADVYLDLKEDGLCHAGPEDCATWVKVTDEMQAEGISMSDDDRHRCHLCRPEFVAKFGRDVWCPNYLAQCIEDQITEDSDDGRAIRAELAKEAAEERVKKAGPQ